MIFGFFIWTIFLILPGWFLSKNEGLVERIAYSSGLSSALLILVFLTKTWVNWPMQYALPILSLVSLASFGFALASNRKNLLPRRPSKTEVAALIAAFVYVPILLYAYLAKFPVFSSSFIVSEDQYSTANLVNAYVINGPPNLLGQLLYYAVHYHLAFLISLNGPNANQFLLTREGMAVFVILSQFYVYAVAKKLYRNNETVGLATLLVYSLSGYLWFSMPFNSGLYPNFFGLLIASPFLIISSIDFLGRNGHGVATAFTLFAAMMVATFSHYSTIFLFPVLGVVGFLASSKAPMKVRSTFLFLMFLPLTIGAAFMSNFLSFLTGDGFSPDLQTNWLATIFAKFPILSYSALLIGNPFASIAILAFASITIIKIKSDRWALLLPSWCAFIILIAPLNNAAWRFAFVLLLPLTLMAGRGFESLARRMLFYFQVVKQRILHHAKSRHSLQLPRPSVLTSIFIMSLLIPTVSQGAFLGFTDDCNPDGICYSKTDYSVYDAMRWMTSQKCGYLSFGRFFNGETQGIIPTYNSRECIFISPTDPRFHESRLVSGANADWNNSLFASPATTAYYIRAKNISYVVVDDLPEYTLPTCYSVAVILRVLNSTVGHAVKFGINLVNIQNASLYRENASASIYINDSIAVRATPITRGEVNGTLDFHHSGTFKVRAQAGVVYSNAETVFVGSGNPPLTEQQNLYQCRPYFWNSNDLGGAVLAYQNNDVKIWCIPRVDWNCP